VSTARGAASRVLGVAVSAVLEVTPCRRTRRPFRNLVSHTRARPPLRPLGNFRHPPDGFAFVNLDVSLITPNGLRLSDTRRAAGTLSALEEQCRSHERRVRGGDGGLGGRG
jgi:hypothetical protein